MDGGSQCLVSTQLQFWLIFVWVVVVVGVVVVRVVFVVGL